jgi:hypothetical protein
MPNAMTTGGGVVLTTLLGSSMFGPTPPMPMSDEPLRIDDALLSMWVSEDITTNSDEPLDGECTFFNFSRAYASSYCDPFSISRMQTSTIRVAADRALRCAAKHDVECVLSAEVGFAVPAAFVADHGSESGMTVVVAPRVIATASSEADQVVEEYVRVSPPGGVFESHTVLFNHTLTAEYMTANKRVETRTFVGPGAFCVQLLRAAFTRECWEQLDRV